MHLIDVVLLLLVGLALFFALRHIRRQRKKGGCSCGCGGSCEGCPGCGGKQK